MIKGIIFDFFGVIYEDNFNKVYASFGGDVQKDKDFIRDTFRSSHLGKTGRSSETFAKHLGVRKDEWECTVDKGRSIDVELVSYIQELRKTYKVAVLSNIGNRGLNAYVTDRFLKEKFDVVVESAQIGYAKPDRRAFEVTLARLDVEYDECIFIDDNEEYIKGAQDVGIKTILYKDYDTFKTELKKLLNA